MYCMRIWKQSDGILDKPEEEIRNSKRRKTYLMKNTEAVAPVMAENEPEKLLEPTSDKIDTETSVPGKRLDLTLFGSVRLVKLVVVFMYLSVHESLFLMQERRSL